MATYQTLPQLGDLLARLQAQTQRTRALSGLELLAPDPHAQPIGLNTPGSYSSYQPPTLPGAPTPGGSYGGVPTDTGGSDTYTGRTNFQPLAPGRYPVQDKTPTPLPDPTQSSPEIQRAADEIWSRWPTATNMGSHVVRNIAGTNTPSQHSYGNAIDIGGSQQELDQIATWAARHAQQLGISQVIYQTSIWTPGEGWHPYSGVPHTNHVHLTGPEVYSDTSPSYPVVNWQPRPPQQPTSTGRPLRSYRNQQR